MQDDFRTQCQKFYELRAGRIILYGRTLGLSRREAEDVLQESFLAVLKLKHPPLQLDHYVLVVFRNRASNFRRGLRRRSMRESESRRWLETRIQDDRQDLVVHHLAELPPRQREVIVLKIWHGQTFEEIGGLLGISPNTAAGRYRYGLQKLRRFLDQLENLPEREASTSVFSGCRYSPFRSAPLSHSGTETF